MMSNQRIGLAVSGGVDSMVMLDIFRRIKENCNLDIVVLHYNHKWRKGSLKDAKVVKKYCETYKLPFIYKEATGAVIKKEDVARTQRYGFLEKSARQYRLQTICTAHHMDDQIETILFRLCRGTGFKGVLPIKEYKALGKGIQLCRPLLGFAKDEILQYAKIHNISYVQDKTNADINYKRNLIRNKIIPNLKLINLCADFNIYQFAKLSQTQSLICEEYCRKLLKKIAISSNKLNRKKFSDLNSDIQEMLIYWFMTWKGMKGSLNKIALIINAICKAQNIDLENNYRLEVTDKVISFASKQKKQRTVDSIGVEFKFNPYKSKAINLSNKQKLIITPLDVKKSVRRFPLDKQKKAFVDLSGFTGKTLTIRNRQAEDVFKPLGFSGIVKLKKYLINKKIPKMKRDKLPMLCDGKEVLWLPGYSLSERIKVKNKPTHELKIVSV